MRELLAPMIALVRDTCATRPIRIVDLGCGLGFIVRWLSARGELGHDVELVGADYNSTLVAAAQRLADDEHLRCRFIAANAFRLREPAHIIMSTGVLHHFRGGALDTVFAEHAQAGVVGFVHADIRPSSLASVGSWIASTRTPEPRVWFVALTAGATALAFERYIGRAHANRWRRLLSPD